ncbi:MAG: HlyD family efflux transporter periplasmic adaptor subunit, partial [Pseudomonadota bacterium]|nr:HlyD family efflux transporter periplasmic adaptor subunit [Pseudomonadota bacterium]
MSDSETHQPHAPDAMMGFAIAQPILRGLTAPVAGTVQQLAVHTVGGVVTPAQPLLVIVPGDNPLEVEAFVENKDIGFVH